MFCVVLFSYSERRLYNNPLVREDPVEITDYNALPRINVSQLLIGAVVLVT